MIKGFKEFILRGNVIDLAVAVVIGTTFTAVVNSIVDGIFNPLIATIFKADSLAKSMPVALPDGGELAVGLVLSALIKFVLIAAVVYFVFVLPINRLNQAQERRRKAVLPTDEKADPVTELGLLSEIRDLLAASATTGPGQGKLDHR